MRKIWTIARREYRAAVRSKAFIVTMVLMPVLMGASIGIQMLFKKLDDNKDKRYAVIDRTGGDLARTLEASSQLYNQHLVFDPQTKKQIASKIILEVIPLDEGTPEAISKVRYELSQRVEKDEIEGIIEIGPKIYEVRGDPTQTPDQIDDEHAIRFQAKKPTQRAFMTWAEQSINAGVQVKRFTEKKLDPI
ncbi:MAG: hypothetical protein K8T89_11185, partial [Planctomycetes bacterium]|nr:hypothetical protein [Planctomycetota bacterium]